MSSSNSSGARQPYIATHAITASQQPGATHSQTARRAGCAPPWLSAPCIGRPEDWLHAPICTASVHAPSDGWWLAATPSQEKFGERSFVIRQAGKCAGRAAGAWNDLWLATARDGWILVDLSDLLIKLQQLFHFVMCASFVCSFGVENYYSVSFACRWRTPVLSNAEISTTNSVTHQYYQMPTPVLSNDVTNQHCLCRSSRLAFLARSGASVMTTISTLESIRKH